MGMSVWKILDNIVINLFFLFNPPTRSGERYSQGDLVPCKSHAVSPIMEDRSYSTDPAGVQRLISDIERSAHRIDIVPYYANLAECRVTAVAHLRSTTSGLHEIVVLKVKRGRDERHLRFERFPEPPQRRDGTVQVLSFEAERRLALLAGKVICRVDATSTSDLWKNATIHYAVVQRFDVPATSEVPVLDAIALPNLLGEVVSKYSILPHMCFWYAAALFHLLHTRIPAAGKIVRGREHPRGGTFDGRALVEVGTGTLLWTVPDSQDRILSAYEAAYIRGLGTEDRAELLAAMHTAVAADADALRSHGSPDAALAVACERASTAVAEVHARIQKASHETVSHPQSKFERKREEIAAINQPEQAERDRRACDKLRAQAEDLELRVAQAEARLAEREAQAAERTYKADIRIAELTAQLRAAESSDS